MHVIYTAGYSPAPGGADDLDGWAYSGGLLGCRGWQAGFIGGCWQDVVAGAWQVTFTGGFTNTWGCLRCFSSLAIWHHEQIPQQTTTQQSSHIVPLQETSSQQDKFNPPIQKKVYNKSVWVHMHTFGDNFKSVDQSQFSSEQHIPGCGISPSQHFLQNNQQVGYMPQSTNPAEGDKGIPQSPGLQYTLNTRGTRNQNSLCTYTKVLLCVNTIKRKEIQLFIV